VKLIDFGLALRPSLLEGQPSTSGSKAQTTMGKTIAGTLHFAAPEQLGQLPRLAVGAYSDVYGFGRSCYFALLGTPEPDDEEKEVLPQTVKVAGKPACGRFRCFHAKRPETGKKEESDRPLAIQMPCRTVLPKKPFCKQCL